MANSKSAERAARRAEKHRARNVTLRSSTRTGLRKVSAAIGTGDKAAATAAFQAAQPEMQRGVTKGVLHKNTVSRKMSRLSSRVKGLAAKA